MSSILHDFCPVDNLGPTQIPGGLLVPVTNGWPRTDLAALPTCQRTAHDVSGDGIADLIVSTRVSLADRDGNGVADAVMLRVTAAEVIQPDAVLDVTLTERANALSRVMQQL